MRAVIRRDNWGDELALVERARRLFGSPDAWGRIRASGIAIVPVEEAGVRGEWLVPREPREGIIFYIHGGGYVSCSPATHRPLTSALAKLSGRRVFSLDYRLAPEHRFPAALDDTIAAYHWLIDKQEIKPHRIAVNGDSAGGGLTLSLLVALRDEGTPLPSCAVLGSPWTDLTGSGRSAHENEGKCHMFKYQNLPDFAAVYLGAATADDPRASPLFSDLSGLPPILFQVGSTELLLDDSRRAHEKIIAAGGSSRLEIFDDTLHAWQMLDGLVPEARVALKQATEFIGANTRQADGTEE